MQRGGGRESKCAATFFQEGHKRPGQRLRATPALPEIRPEDASPALDRISVDILKPDVKCDAIKNPTPSVKMGSEVMPFGGKAIGFDRGGGRLKPFDGSTRSARPCYWIRSRGPKSYSRLNGIRISDILCICARRPTRAACNHGARVDLAQRQRDPNPAWSITGSS